MIKVLFFLCLLGILHSYILYPLGMRLLGLFFRKPRFPELPAEDQLPTVEIIFAAFNEESVIRQKILSSFSSSYPAHKLSVRIGSDASSDRTDAIIRDLQKNYPQLYFKRFEARTGKAGIINDLWQQSQADLIIFTDANIIFGKNTISQLVAPALAPKTGIVGGEIKYSRIGKAGISRQEDLYLRWENGLKRLESRIFGRAMGVEGGCYLIRRELFPGIPPLYFMEDFYVSLSVMKQGYRVLVNPGAECFEDVSVLSSEEFKRKTRISIGNFQNLRAFSGWMLREFFPGGFIFLSHKVLRWLTPFFLLLLVPLSALLAASGIFYGLFAGLYFMFIGLGMLGILLSQKQSAGVLKYPGHFIHMNLALFKGFLIFIKGVQTNAWQPTRRNQV